MRRGEREKRETRDERKEKIAEGRDEKVRDRKREKHTLKTVV